MVLVLRLHSGEIAELGASGDFRDPLMSLRTVWTAVCVHLSVYVSVCVYPYINTHANWRIKARKTQGSGGKVREMVFNLAAH